MWLQFPGLLPTRLPSCTHVYTCDHTHVYIGGIHQAHTPWAGFLEGRSLPLLGVSTCVQARQGSTRSGIHRVLPCVGLRVRDPDMGSRDSMELGLGLGAVPPSPPLAAVPSHAWMEWSWVLCLWHSHTAVLPGRAVAGRFE